MESTQWRNAFEAEFRNATKRRQQSYYRQSQSRVRANIVVFNTAAASESSLIHPVRSSGENCARVSGPRRYSPPNHRLARPQR